VPEDDNVASASVTDNVAVTPPPIVLLEDNVNVSNVLVSVPVAPALIVPEDDNNTLLSVIEVEPITSLVAPCGANKVSSMA
jgi:hypothetical protein